MMPSPLGTIDRMTAPECPRCGRAAPIVMRGVKAYCAACGSPRLPLGSMPVNVAGKPSTIGGTVAYALGWSVLGVGLFASFWIWWLFERLFEVGLLVASPVAFITLIVSTILILGGRKLRKSGESAARNAHEKALYSLAKARGGVLFVADAARALNIPQAEADTMLTDLAKRPEANVSLEVDGDGNLTYQFIDYMPRVRARVDVPPQQQQRVRVGGSADAEAEQEVAEAEAARRARR